MNCPKCDSARFYLVQRTYEYHTIDAIEDDGNVLLLNLEDAVMDTLFPPHLYCASCNTIFDTDQNEIIPPEVIDVPISIEVNGETS